MPVTIDTTRIRSRRAALRAALRRGDVIGAARAWERLGFDGEHLGREELRAARQARAALGRAIRDARRRREQAVTRSVPASALPLFAGEGTLRRYRAATTTAALLLLVIASSLAFPPRAGEPLPPAAPELTTQAQAEPTRAPAAGRGRTAASLAPVVPTPSTAPSPTPAPTAAPTPNARTAPGSNAPVRSSSPSGVPGGVAGGVTGGIVGGVPGGHGTGTPAPAPTLNVLPLTPPPLETGSDRFLFRVVDARTQAPLANACVIYGTHTCGPADPHTNANGYFWIDLYGNVSPTWSFRFTLDGYISVTVNKTHRAGQGTVVTTVDLRKR